MTTSSAWWSAMSSLTIMRQLGLAHDATSLAGRASLLITHPVTVTRALTRRLMKR